MLNILRLYRDPVVGDGGGSATTTIVPSSSAAPASVSASLALPATSNTGGTPAVGTFAIPEAYKDKPYLKGVDNLDKVWSMLDGAQELIGKRPAGIPAPDAPQAEWDKFYEAVGRPKTSAEYKFDYGVDDKGQPKAAPDAKWEASVKDLMFKHGITAKQAVSLQKDFDTMVGNVIKEKNLTVQQDNTDFTKTATELFGAERDKVLSDGKALLTEHVKDPRVNAALARLPNDALMVLASALKSISTKFIRSEGAPLIPPGGGNTGVSGGGKEGMHAEARRLMSLPEYSNSMHPDNTKVLARVNQLYLDAAKLPN